MVAPAPLETSTVLEKVPSAVFRTKDASCQALYASEHEPELEGMGVACAPSKPRRSCRVVKDSRGAPVLLELSIIETLATEHCADGPGAPRTKLGSIVVAPATAAPSGGLRVSIDSRVYAPGTSSMRDGQHDGVVTLEASSEIGDRDDVLRVFVLRTQNVRCARLFTVCDRAHAWCTRPYELSSGRCGQQDDEPLPQFEHEAGVLRVRDGQQTLRFTLDRHLTDGHPP